MLSVTMLIGVAPFISDISIMTFEDIHSTTKKNRSVKFNGLLLIIKSYVMSHQLDNRHKIKKDYRGLNNVTDYFWY